MSRVCAFVHDLIDRTPMTALILVTKHGAIIEVDSHLFFLAHPSRDFFFTHAPPFFAQLPYSKNIFPPTPLLNLCYRFFFKARFLFLVIVIVLMVPSPTTIANVWRRIKSCYNFKVWATWGATFSRRHQNKVCHLKIIYTCGFFTFSIWV